MKKIIFFLIISFTGLGLNAQVHGTVIDSASKKPVDRAVIGLVVKSNTADTLYTFTDEKGFFSFENVPSSNFSIVVHNMGYFPVAKFVLVNKPEKTIEIGNVVIAYRGKILDEVVVLAAAVIIKEDTVEYNAASFKVKENAVVEDLLKKLPGVQVDKDGNVTAQGKSVTRVKVNGKDFFGGDVKTATRELPANIVDKIQVIDDYGDQATVSGIKDGDPDKIINIQIKKDKNKGFFGRITAGAGTEDRYQASFNGNYFNNTRQISLIGNSNNNNSSLFNFGGGGNRGATSMMRTGMSAMNDMGGMSGMNNMVQGGNMSLLNGNSPGGISSTNSFGTNYRDQWGKKISVYGSYSYSHKNTSQLQQSAIQNFYTSNAFINNQYLDALTISDAHRATFNMELQADSFNYFKISPSYNFSESDANNFSRFDYKLPDSTKTSDGTNKNLTKSNAPNLAATVLYNHKFRKRGRNFSASFTWGNSESNSTQDVVNLSYQYQGPFTGPFNNFQYLDQANNNHNYGARFTYSEPVSKYRSLDFSYSHNINYARNNKKTFNVDSLTQAKTYNGFLSNDYENNFYNNRIGLSLRTTKKKYNYSIGISFQPVDLKGRSITKDSAYRPINRLNIFPIARMVYNFSRTKSLNFSYSGNATQPTFTQLQPVLDFSNFQSGTAGNPDLKPSITNNFNFTFNNFNFVSGKVLFTNLTFTSISNQIVNKSAKLDDNGRSLAIPENVNGYYNLLGFYAFSRPYKNRKYVITFTGSANFNHNINLTDSAFRTGPVLLQNLALNKVIGNNWVLSQGFNFEFNYKDWLELGTGVSYSLNDVKYNNATGFGSSAFINSSSNAWTLSSNINLDITRSLTLKYDFDYTVNSGLSGSVSRNLAIMNASLEKQLFKKKNGILKLAAYDLFKQNTNISRSVSANYISDTRVNRLTRYFLATFTYRLQKFAGVQPQGGGFRGMGGGPRF